MCNAVIYKVVDNFCGKLQLVDPVVELVNLG